MAKWHPNSGRDTPQDQIGRSRDYEVGHGRPPVATRFKPGQSGNSKGRPKGAKNLSTLAFEKLQAKVPVREGGRERRMSKAEIGVTKLVNRFAETGDLKTYMALLKHLEGPSKGNDTAGAKVSTATAEEQPSQNEILTWFLAQHSGSEGDEQ